MLSWFVPREAKFFDMFRSASDIFVEGAKELNLMIDDLKNVSQHAQNIKTLEHRADKLTQSVIEELHLTFITPLDRDDMYRLTSKMDDIMDYIDAASQRFHLYEIQTTTPEVRELGKLILQSAEKVRVAVASLENMKNSENIIQVCNEIRQLENQSDEVMRTGMAKLFREDLGFKEFIKLKEVLELLESVTDRCKDVANIIEGIVLDHA